MGTTEFEDFIQEFDYWCDMQILHNARLFSPFLAWNELFHEFRKNHVAEIELWK
jgi:hypothetical protein